MIVGLLVVVAVVVLLWPSAQESVYPFAVPPAKPASSTPSFVDAVTALQTVRARLAATGALAEAQQQALAALTLALSTGGDQ